MNHYYQDIPGFFDFQDVYARAVKEAPQEGALVEVGAWLGCSLAFLATEMVNQGRLDLKLYSVDHIVRHTFPKGYPDTLGQLERARKLGYEGMTMQAALNRALRPCILEGLKWEHLTGTSDEVTAQCLADASVDFVFLDASHDHDGILTELAAWWPKVKSGGVLAGHDHTPTFPGVIQGVREFFDGKASPTSKSSFRMTKP